MNGITTLVLEEKLDKTEEALSYLWIDLDLQIKKVEQCKLQIKTHVEWKTQLEAMGVLPKHLRQTPEPDDGSNVSKVRH